MKGPSKLAAPISCKQLFGLKFRFELNYQNVLLFAQTNQIEANIPHLNNKNMIEAQKTVCKKWVQPT